MQSKTCTKCRATKPLEAFYANPRAADGHFGSCKLCHNETRRDHKRKRRAANPLPPKKTLAELLWTRVATGVASACWPWTGAKKHFGYGKMNFSGKCLSTHRLAWALTNGPIPPGLCVCHHCDNPPCCNPAHLFLGTLAENNADMRAKGRAVTPRNMAAVTPNARSGRRGFCLFGSSNPSAKLTEADIPQIRNAVALGEEIASVAKRFAITKATIKDVCRRRSWRQIA